MPYLIKCNHCSVDIILDKISIMGQFNCPNCSNLNYQSEFTINNISKEEYRIRYSFYLDEIIDFIKGSYGEVKFARDIINHNKVALKIYEKFRLHSKKRR